MSERKRQSEETEVAGHSAASACNDWLSSDLSLRTLMLMMADLTHKIDELEEDDDNPTFEHAFSRHTVIRELRAMFDYISHAKRK